MQIKRLRLHFTGIVQGVGFRPHTYRLATALQLSGFVCNRPDGVRIEIEGLTKNVDEFIRQFPASLPDLAIINKFTIQEITPENRANLSGQFEIRASPQSGLRKLTIGADTATCPACLAEMNDPDDRRYRYPFINCTDCGPRLTIVNDLPYDRQRTAMAIFPLCDLCQKEYDNPANRRFHAEATACPKCGPEIFFYDNRNRELARGTDAVLTMTQEFLEQGRIIAIKGLGGFHLAVDAGNPEAVATLRRRKRRDKRPFALMVKDLQTAASLAHINETEEKLLLNSARPILLLKKKAGPDSIAKAVAGNLATYGIMLPYTPLHHLLFTKAGFSALVMTSANLNSEPMLIDNNQAQIELKQIADYFLLHNRDIIVRLDDSILMAAGESHMIVRRARGYVPQTIPLTGKTATILALGGHLKNSICLIKEKEALFSPHIGDLDHPKARNFFAENIELIKKIGNCDPEIIACDLHPDYYSSMVAAKMTGKTVIRVQHHHAHIVSCMADNMISGKVLGLALDGTGLGRDGTIWGGEYLWADEKDFIRVGQLACFPLPGGDKAALQPWRCGLSLLKMAHPDNWLQIARKIKCGPQNWSDADLELLLRQTANRPLTSSLGRFFDGVAALIGFSGEISYEGQAAIELEALACREPGPVAGQDIDVGNLLSWEISKNRAPQPGAAHYQLNLLPMITELTQRLLASQSKTALARLFHDSLIAALMSFADRLCREYEIDKIVLSGGCLQNRLLLEGCRQWPEIEAAIYSHQQVPTNDGGLALGQALIAAAQSNNVTGAGLPLRLKSGPTPCKLVITKI